MKICGKDFSTDVIRRIQETVDATPDISRRALSLQVCEWLGWNGRNGRPKEMSCRVALLRLHRRKQIKLSVSKAKETVFQTGKPREATVDFLAVEGTLTDLGGIEIVQIKSGDHMHSSIWNTMMERYHYLGAGPLCGAQIRYLIKSSSYGWLGGLSFSAAAWRVNARDRWIGWSDGARREHLSLVVCNSRFLINPVVRVPHLASHVLSRCVKRLDLDWEERYGYKPVLLETYVEQGRFAGTCYRAANWQHIGETQGRGRQDRERIRALPVKDLYVYPLRSDAKGILCEEPVCTVAQTLSKSRAPIDWAEEEFGRVELGDKRLTQRLVSIARDFYARPQAAIPQACQTRAKTKAAYRLFDHPETHMEVLLSQHYTATVNRCKEEHTVLAVQDTTSLNYSAHPATADLGPIGSTTNGPIGFLVHDTLAFNLDGTPLGLLDVQSWARDPAEFGKKHKRHDLPIEQKESNKWLKSYEKVAQAQQVCPDTVFVSVGDREADIYELFKMATEREGLPRLLVRAEHDRMLVDGQGHLWEHLAKLDAVGIQEVSVPRQSNRPARIAKLEVRFAEVHLNPPKHHKHLQPVRVWAVLAREIEAPVDKVPLEWMLLSTCPVHDFDQAVEKLVWYAKRWGIEVYHRTLKSGCKIEERQLGAADRIEACLAVDMVVAWRIYHLAKLGREIPDVPCTVYFEDAEWKALVAYITRNPVPPAQPPSLRDAMRMAASLGGFLGRKCDGEPGTKSLWLGLQRIDDLAAMWIIMMEFIHSTTDPPS
jgi:hypothetical protein